MKSRNIVAKRIKVTTKEKILHRTCGQNHFNAKESARVTRNKRRSQQMSRSFRKTILRAV